jgi:hypothetical protein
MSGLEDEDRADKAGHDRRFKIDSLIASDAALRSLVASPGGSAAIVPVLAHRRIMPLQQGFFALSYRSNPHR